MMRLRLLLACMAVVATACAGNSTPTGGPSAQPTGPSASASSVAAGPEDDAVNPSATPAPGVHCGYVRWAVKTGSDALASSINLHSVHTTIAALRAEKPPYDVAKGGFQNYRRFPAEERTVTITGTIVAYNLQQDNDFHIVVVDQALRSVIVEIPNPLCVKATSPFLAGITKARKAFVSRVHWTAPAPPPGKYAPPFHTANIPVQVTGVVFFDAVHGQHGVAPNGVEVHPVYAIRFLGHRSSPSASPTPTASSSS